MATRNRVRRDNDQGQAPVRSVDRDVRTPSGDMPLKPSGACYPFALEIYVTNGWMDAKEGADRVAERIRRRDPKLPLASSDGFRCEACGSNKLVYLERSSLCREDIFVTWCLCGAELGYAAKRGSRLRREVLRVIEIYPYPREERRTTFDLEQARREYDEPVISCDKCTQRATRKDWEMVRGADPMAFCHDVALRCAGCGREIEFAWEGRVGSGKLVPVEVATFDPAGLVPDPKYRANWKARGWV